MLINQGDKKMSAVEKIAKLDNVIVNVKVSATAGSENFIGFVTLNQFDPDKMQANGGPIARKVVDIQAMGSTYDEAFNNALERAVQLMGL
jgi:hypothetical protein